MQTPHFTSTASDADFVLSSIGEESCSDSSAESSITELPTNISHSINQSTLDISIPKESTKQNDFPNIYSADQWFEKTTTHPWLIYHKSKLGCFLCKKVSLLGNTKTQGSSISEHWSKCTVSYSGNSKHAMLILEKDIETFVFKCP